MLGVDFNPEAVRKWREKGLDAIFGDADDPEVLAHLPLTGVRAVISTIPRSLGPLMEADGHMTAIRTLRNLGFNGVIAVTVDGAEKGAEYLDMGATLLLSPFDDAAEAAVERLCAVVGNRMQPDLTRPSSSDSVSYPVQASRS
ncbi:MAG: NAD-binding protein [Roseiflexaceae bacterium]|nr:NAD-binding protein [Roseiflexaceae bacterium]